MKDGRGVFAVFGCVVVGGIFISCLCFPPGSGMSPSSWTCHDWNELSSEKQQSFETIAKKVIGHLAQDDLEGLWNIAHPSFKTDGTPDSLRQLLNKMGVSGAAAANATRYDGRFINVATGSTRRVSVKCGAMSGPKSLAVQIHGGVRQQAVILYTFPDPPFERRMALRLEFHETEFKMIGLFLNTKSYLGKGPEYYNDLSKRMESEGKLLPAALHALRSAAFGRIGPGLSKKKSIELGNRSKELFRRPALKQELSKITFDGKGFRAFYFDANARKTGLETIISYVSNRPLGPETTPEEAKGYIASIRTAYPKLGDELKMLTLRAYSELPTDKSRSYPSFDVEQPLAPRPEESPSEPVSDQTEG